MPSVDLLAASAYDFDLPADRIAAEPTARRAESRLLVLPTQGAPQDRVASDLPALLRAGDLVVVNDVAVTPALLTLERSSGGKVEVLVVGYGEEGLWEDPTRDVIALFRSNRRIREGEALFGRDAAEVLVLRERLDASGLARFRCTEGDAAALLRREGALPLPPYIRKRRRSLGLAEAQELDRERYQTVYASRMGAVAAPTAGLHLDQALLGTLQEVGIELATLRLAVGIGTFRPVETEDLRAHRMHSERFHVPAQTAEAIARTRAAGGRIVAIGTTVVRALEAAATPEGGVRAGEASTDLFIHPGYRFRAVDLLLTNFHLPRSTLLALVCAFGGHAEVMAAYAHAVRAGYRFFSYGDAMLLHRREDL